MRAILYEKEEEIRRMGWRILGLKLRLAKEGISTGDQMGEMTRERVRNLEDAVDAANLALSPSGTEADRAAAMARIDKARRTP